MLIQTGLMLLVLVCVAYGAAVMRKIEQDVAEYQRSLHTVQEEQSRLDVACKTLNTLIHQVQDELDKARQAANQVATAKAEAEAELSALSDAPKQRIYMFDRATLGHAKLWELVVANAENINQSMPPDMGMEWATGRTYILPGTTDRDARSRADPRFPSSLGFRITKVERFRRG